jgi:phospholipid-binding lipoprotein MlaA
MNNKTALLLGVMLAGALQGCATSHDPDPLEPWNRKVFVFNESLDANVVKPVAEGYKAVTPEPVRTAFTNFVGNFKEVWSTANLFLQGRFRDGTLGVIRVTVNSTFGLAGLIDIATPMQLYKSNEDFGQTLGVWGVKPGAYLVWPVLGSSTLRDSAGMPADMYFSVSSLGTYPREENLLRSLQIVNARANFLGATNLVDDVALDKYSFVRDAYLQRRQNLIYEGDPPDEDEPQDMSQPDSVAPPAAGASEVGAASVADAPVKTAQAESAALPWAMFP